MAGMSQMLMGSPVFWLGLILTPVAALLSDFSIKTLINTVFKSVTDQVCEREINLQRSESGKLLEGSRRDSRTKLVETARLLRSVRNVFRRPNTAADGARGQTELELSHGYAFSQEEHGAVRQGDMVRAYDTENVPLRTIDRL